MNSFRFKGADSRAFSMAMLTRFMKPALVQMAGRLRDTRVDCSMLLQGQSCPGGIELAFFGSFLKRLICTACLPTVILTIAAALFL